MTDSKPIAERGQIEQMAFGRYLGLCAMGPPCAIELYQSTCLPTHVARVTVRRVKPGSYRAIVLHTGDSTRPHAIDGSEGDRDALARWLRAEGIPVLRIGVCQSW